MRKFGLSRQVSTRLQDSWQRLYRVAYSWTHNPDLAADLVQGAMEKALRKHHQLREMEAFDSWLYTILVNVWRDQCRRATDTTELDEEILIQTDTPEHEFSRNELLRRTQLAIARLQPSQREVLTLVTLEGFAYEQVAQILGIPVGTVMSRLCRARRNLEQSLEISDSRNVEATANVRRIK